MKRSLSLQWIAQTLWSNECAVKLSKTEWYAIAEIGLRRKHKTRSGIYDDNSTILCFTVSRWSMYELKSATPS